MTYKLFDRFGSEINHKDLQAKKIWCKDGEKIEEAFVSNFGSKLDTRINPEKVNNPYAPDLLYKKDNLADLKTQNTPFFKAKELYNIDPTYAVVFNRKDAVRYYKLYPEIIIFIWVEWHSVRFEMDSLSKTVEYLNGVWKINFCDLVDLLKVAPMHDYIQRKYDKIGNAKSSFVLDIRQPSFEKVI